MSSVVISGDTSGAITVAAPAVAGTNTATLPAATGTIVVGSSAVSAAGQIPFSTDGTSYTPTAKIVSGTSQATTSGTAIGFTSIPSWVKRITIMFQGVSTNGTSVPIVQLGSTSYTTTGYTGSQSIATTAVSSSLISTGFNLGGAGAASVRNGTIIITNLTSNTWSAFGILGFSDGAATSMISGVVSLSGTLDRIQLTTVNGTDTFDAGSINILYE